MNHRDQTLMMMQSLSKKRKKTPMQSMKKLSFLTNGLSDYEQYTIGYKIRYNVYMQHEDLR